MFAICAVSALLGSVAGQFAVQIESDGAYHISVNKQLWLSSGPTFFRNDGSLHSTADGSLKQKGQPRTISGVDTLGHWKGQILSYSSGRANVSVSVRVYDATNGKLAIFTQVYIVRLDDLYVESIYLQIKYLSKSIRLTQTYSYLTAAQVCVLSNAIVLPVLAISLSENE